ncbi:NlpC/P60 family protein [Streptomyces polyrhachis]|uniref:NlpC/P60 family protein n=1 Tax=Streptomyces polyrhachis TaxID=1282885 RepID=A0ABW2GKV6_9ACTN
MAGGWTGAGRGTHGGDRRGDRDAARTPRAARARRAHPARRRIRTLTTVLLALAAGFTAPAVRAQPAPSAQEVHAQIQELYHRAEIATDAYNGVEERLAQQQRAVTAVEKETSAARARLERLREQAGALARAQYRSGGFPTEAQLMLSDHPQDFFDGLHLTDKAISAQTTLIRDLGATENALQGYTADAKDLWERLESDRRQQAKVRKEIEEQLAEAKLLESRLAADERRLLTQWESDAARANQAAWLGSGILDDIDATASEAGKRAIRYATAQLGKDYEWGAEGPDTFDCSGLTMRAWQAAGFTIPRTSQTQWQGLTRVDVRDMRPGDLIIYKSDASHVALYIGDGRMLHAPRTGRQITIEGAGSLPILGVVRPDA